MNGLQKLGFVCLAFSILVAGCGKKKEKKVTTTKKMAQVESIPLAKEEVESLLDDSTISEFAFVDDIDQLKDATVATAENDSRADGLIALDDQNIVIDTDEDGAGDASAYAFKAVHFDFDKNSIRPDQRPVVAKNIEVAQEAVGQGKVLVIEGHCDQVGSASYNLALSQRRAESVKAEMAKNGIATAEVKTVGYGYERPVVWSDASDRKTLIKELALNRRAEILVN